MEVVMQVSVGLSRRKNSDNSAHDCIISYEEFSQFGKQYCKMDFHSQILGNYSATETDIFGCLMTIRKIIEEKGWLLLCQGACIRNYPTGMSRSMTGGYILYLQQLGKEIKRENKVKMFDPATLDQVGTVDEQIDFHQQWLKSIKETQRND
jgi:hypothetical protein